MCATVQHHTYRKKSIENHRRKYQIIYDGKSIRVMKTSGQPRLLSPEVFFTIAEGEKFPDKYKLWNSFPLIHKYRSHWKESYTLKTTQWRSEDIGDNELH